MHVKFTMSATPPTPKPLASPLIIIIMTSIIADVSLVTINISYVMVTFVLSSGDRTRLCELYLYCSANICCATAEYRC